MKRAALGIFAVLVIGIAAFWVFDPFAVAVIGDMLFGRMLGERQSTPDIAKRHSDSKGSKLTTAARRRIFSGRPFRVVTR
jgi:hypothetical protein